MTENPFVSTGWLAAHLSNPGVAVIDGSWYLPNANRDAHAEYLAAHIPGAAFFDVDAIADQASGLPHMLPQPASFAEVSGVLGVGDGMRIVVYDGDGLFSAPRVRWTFMTMGATDVVLLEGGLPKWRAEGHSLESGLPAIVRRIFTPHYDASAVTSIDDVRKAISTGSRQIVDARPAPRFLGQAPEPRPGLKSGHMPGAKSAPSGTLTANGTLKPATELRDQFAAAGIDLEKPIVTTCGSGVTAATLKLALERAGATDVSLYDGSWAEWGARDDTPVVTD